MKVELKQQEPTPPPLKDVVITLNEAEAQALITLMANITDHAYYNDEFNTGEGIGPINQLVRNLWNQLHKIHVKQDEDGSIWTAKQPELNAKR